MGNHGLRDYDFNPLLISPGGFTPDRSVHNDIFAASFLVYACDFIAGAAFKLERTRDKDIVYVGLVFFVQKKGPRSPKLFLFSVVVFFLVLLLIPHYRDSFQWLAPSIALFIGIGAIANMSAIREMKK